jgi:hypothetical protein
MRVAESVLTELLQMGLIEQIEKGGIGGPALEVQAQNLVQDLKVPLGERLQIPKAAAVAEDPEHRHHQQVPLRVPHPAPVAAIRDRLEEADQVIRCRLIGCSRVGFGHQCPVSIRLMGGVVRRLVQLPASSQRDQVCDASPAA